MKKLQIAIAAASAAIALNSKADLVVNGGFESHTGYNGSGWNYFDGGGFGGSVTGWSSGSVDIPLEVGRPSVYGVSGTGLGDAVMELDTTRNVVATQPLATIAASSYTISFVYALRSGVSPSSGTLDVYFGGVLIDSLNPLVAAMTAYSKTVTSIAGNDVLEFRGTGTSDSYGALIDNVSVEAVPEPTTVIAGALLLLPFGASVLRSYRNKRSA